MRAKCLSTLYNCCKYGILHWPDTDDEYDPDELLEELQEAGHSDNPEDYSDIMPEPAIWKPFMLALKKRPKQSQSKTFRLQMDHKIQWECATTSATIQTIKAAMNDQEKLLSILKSMSIIPQDHTSVVYSDQINQIISTLKIPGVTTAKSTRASKKKRVWALLPDLGIANKLEQR